MKKINKKGFTLIELLAVIVILAIIALIATPIILNMINKAKKNAARSSALGYIDAIEYNNGLAEVDPDNYTSIESGDVSTINVKLKGKKPTSGTVTINESGRVTKAENLCINGYLVIYENGDATVGNKCSDGGESTPAVTWNNYITSSQASGGSTLPANSTAWIQENTTSGDKELCGAFPNGTVCMISSYNNNTVGKSSDFEDATYSGEYTIANISQSGLKGYALEKAEEMLNAGATSCSFGSDYLHCDSSDLECDIFDDSGAHLSCYTGINQNNHCEINDDDSYGCY